MLTNIILCVSFVAGVLIMYIGLRKILGIMEEGFSEGEEKLTEPVKADLPEKSAVRKKTTGSVKEKKPVRRRWTDNYAPEHTMQVSVAAPTVAPKPRISLKNSAGEKVKSGVRQVLIGSGSQYSVKMKKV